MGCVKRVAKEPGVKAIIFRSPCIAIVKTEESMRVDAGKCINCKKCIRELGCPALIIEDGQVCIDPSLCTGCGLCAKICPTNAIIDSSDTTLTDVEEQKGGGHNE